MAGLDGRVSGTHEPVVEELVNATKRRCVAWVWSIEGSDEGCETERARVRLTLCWM